MIYEFSITVSTPILALIPITDPLISLALIIHPSDNMDLSSIVLLNLEGGSNLGLVKILLSLSNKLNLGTSSVKPILASKKESIFPMSVQYPSY